MNGGASGAAESDPGTERDLALYRTLIEMWSRENPIKTAKLQVLLAVNALLVSAVNLSGGIEADRWFVYLAGFVFSLIWTFSIGRTSLFQEVWQLRIRELQARYPRDPRFSVLENSAHKMKAGMLLRIFGGIPSHWYLIFSPIGFAIAWLVVIAIAYAEGQPAIG